jgi:hypothetical protein
MENGMIQVTKPRFHLGKLVATPGAIEALEQSSQSAFDFLVRHGAGDWGDVCADDKEANEQSLLDGSRLLSAYRTTKGVKLWVITEAADDRGNRACTTILMPSEY